MKNLPGDISSITPIDVITISGIFHIHSFPDIPEETIIFNNNLSDYTKHKEPHISTGEYVLHCYLVLGFDSSFISGNVLWVPAIKRYLVFWRGESWELLLFPNGISWDSVIKNLSDFLDTKSEKQNLLIPIWNQPKVLRNLPFLPPEILEYAISIHKVNADPKKYNEGRTNIFIGLLENAFTRGFMEEYLHYVRALLLLYICKGRIQGNKNNSSPEDNYFLKCEKPLDFIFNHAPAVGREHLYIYLMIIGFYAGRDEKRSHEVHMKLLDTEEKLRGMKLY